MKRTLQSMLLALSLSANAQTVSTATIENAVKDVGGRAASTVIDIQKPETIVPKYNNTQTGNGDLFGEGEIIPINPGNMKVSNCSQQTMDKDLYKRQECEGINFVTQSKGKRPNMAVTTNDPIVAGNRSITGNPVPTLVKHGWSVPLNQDGSVGSMPANACSPTTVSVPAQYEFRYCSVFKQSEKYLCQQNLIATVKPHFNYRCNDVLGINSTETCKKILQVRCENGGNTCAQAGVVPTSYDADMAITFTPIGDGFFRINFGVYQDNYWAGPASINNSNRGAIYYKKLIVNVSGIDRLARFSLDKVHEDDYSLIKVNGVVAYATYPVVDRIENADINVTSQSYGTTTTRVAHVIKVGNDKYLPYSNWLTSTMTNVERAPDFSAMAYPNFNAIPYLVEGTNTIETWTLVGNRGELYTEWTTQMYCPAKCTEAWQDQCSALAERAK